MKEFKEKRKNNFWHSPIFLFSFFVLLVFFAWNTIGLIEKERETSKNKEISLNKMNKLKEKAELYNNNIDRLNTDIGVEELVRSKFQVSKPGEKVVSIVDSNETETQDDSSSNNGFWFWFLDLFKDNK